MSLNKKAAFELRKAIYWTIAMVVLTIFIFGAFFTLGIYQNKLTLTPTKLRSELIGLRFANTPECFAWEENGIVTHGTIDLNKFTKDTMNQCYSTEEKKGFKTFNFRLRLESSGQELMTNNYFDDGKDDYTIFKEILLAKEGKLSKDRLIIYVQEKI